LGVRYIGASGACGKTRVAVQSHQAKPERSEKEELRMLEHAVVIAGDGPTGMMPAAELAVAKVVDA
jgi:ribulose 1,5-bisphosphate synthetase/thiazole synthase